MCRKCENLYSEFNAGELKLEVRQACAQSKPVQNLKGFPFRRRPRPCSKRIVMNPNEVEEMTEHFKKMEVIGNAERASESQASKNGAVQGL